MLQNILIELKNCQQMLMIFEYDQRQFLWSLKWSEKSMQISEILSYSPLVFLIFYLEYKKIKFLKGVKNTRISFKNLNRKSISLKVLIVQFQIFIFVLYWHFIHLDIINNINEEYRTIYNSGCLSIFIFIIITTTGTIKDFYIKDECIIYPFSSKEHLTKISSIKIQKQTNKTFCTVIIDKVQKRNSSKLRKRKLVINKNNLKEFNSIFKSYIE